MRMLIFYLLFLQVLVNIQFVFDDKIRQLDALDYMFNITVNS